MGALGAHFPGLEVVVEEGTFRFVNDYLSLVAYFDSVGVSHQEETSTRRHATGVQLHRFSGWPLLGSTQTADTDFRGTLVLAWLHY